MLLMARISVLPSIYKAEEISSLRKSFGQHVVKMKESGKLLSGWGLAGGRGAFLLFSVDSGEELLDLLSPVVLDNANVDVYPVLELEKLGAFFTKYAK